VFPQALSQVCAGVGVALLSLSFVVLRYYKSKVNKLVNEEFSHLLRSRDISKFTKKIEQKKVTFQMVSDFYQQFLQANAPSFMLERAWRCLLLSGALFILSSVTGSIDVIPIDIIAYQCLASGFFILFVSFYYLVQLENRL
jgi:hypothetical protein